MLLLARAKAWAALGLRALKKAPVAYTPGLPPGLKSATLNGLCLRYLEQPLQSAAYRHLSYWRYPSGAYRLELRSQGGRRWHLIYKNDLIDPDDLPAFTAAFVAGLSRPAYTEYLLYSRAPEGLRRYLPRLYLCREQVPGRHYQYLFQALGGYRAPSTPGDLLRVVGALPALHRALGDWANALEAPLIVYAEASRPYVEHFLERYLAATGDEVLGALWARRQDFSALPGRDRLAEVPPTPIHGDLTPANVLVAPRRLKVIDWDSVTLGTPYGDLATLLRRSSPALERAALEHYSRARPELSPDEHRRCYDLSRFDLYLRIAAVRAAAYLAADAAAARERHRDLVTAAAASAGALFARLAARA